MKDWINKYLSEDDLLTIKEEVRKVELITSGEIRISLKQKRSFFEKLYKPHELAEKAFEELGVWKTKEQTGILIFILFEEKYYDILADEGIFAKIPDKVWNDIEDGLREKFHNGNYLDGMLHIITSIGKVLEKEFPRKDDDENELSDELLII